MSIAVRQANYGARSLDSWKREFSGCYHDDDGLRQISATDDFVALKKRKDDPVQQRICPVESVRKVVVEPAEDGAAHFPVDYPDDISLFDKTDTMLQSIYSGLSAITEKCSAKPVAPARALGGCGNLPVSMVMAQRLTGLIDNIVPLREDRPTAIGA